MTVTYRDELGIVSVKINDEYGVSFDGCSAYFTSEDDKDYKINTERLISITAE